MSNNHAKVKEFEPGVYISLFDVMTGIRKLARVNETGKAYVDLDTEDCTPLPIYETLSPEEAGNMLGWGLHLIDTKPELQPAWKELCDRLINSGEGVLTYNRAAYWAFMNRNFDFDQALQAGRSETATIAGGRQAVDQLAREAGGLS